MVTNHVITCFMENQGKILLLRRSSQVGLSSQMGRHKRISARSGSALSQAYLEIKRKPACAVMTSY